MAGYPSANPPAPPAGAPSWATVLTNSIVRWVEAKLSGPLRLTGYAALPSPSDHAFALAWNKTDAIPDFCSGTSWGHLAAYVSGTATGTTSGTLNALAGKLTTGSLSTAAGTSQPITINNDLVAAADMVLVSLAAGSNTAGIPGVTTVAVSAGVIAVTLANLSGSAAFNGSFVISFHVLKA